MASVRRRLALTAGAFVGLHLFVLAFTYLAEKYAAGELAADLFIPPVHATYSMEYWGDAHYLGLPPVDDTARKMELWNQGIAVEDLEVW